MRKNAFTLTETLLMVAVVGIIAVISAVSLKNITPDKDVVMIRKAYTDVSKAVAVLINNQDLYPYARVAMKNVDSKLNPMLQYVASATCNDLATESGFEDDNKTSSLIDQNQRLQYAVSCGGGGGGGGTTSTSSSTSSSSSSTSSAGSTSYAEEEVGCLASLGPNGTITGCSDNCFLSSGECHSSIGMTDTFLTSFSMPSSTSSSSTSSSSTSSSSTSSSTTSFVAASFAVGSSSTFSSYSLEQNTYDYIPYAVNPKGDDISKGSGSVSGSNLYDGTYADKPLQQTGSSVDLAAHGSVFLNTAVMDDSTKYTSNNKFAYNFAKLFKNNDLTCSGRICEFTTPDGMEWTVTDKFSASEQNATIMVDINGSAGVNSSTANKPDRFTFAVDASGAITISGDDAAATKAKRVLKDRKAKK